MNYYKTMDRLMKNEIETEYVRGNSALVLHDGEEIYFNAFGYADYEKKIPMKRDTIIRLYSMTKPITAVALMIVQERGLVDLLDPVSKYLPEFSDMKIIQDGKLRPASKRITLMNLLTMTSGIPYGENWEGCSEAGREMQKLFDEMLAGLRTGEKLSTREIIKKIATVPIAFEPGERWMYGLSADIIAAVIEVVTGERYSEFLKREIFVPLQMCDTGFYVPEEKLSRFSMNYDWRGEEGLVPCDDSYLMEYYKEDVAYEAGGCGLVSTIDDYSRFAMMLMNGGTYKGKKIIGSASVDFLTTNHLTSGQTNSLEWDSNMGYGYGGLMRVLVSPTRAGIQAPIGEFGWDGWTGNYVSIDKENRLIIIYFMQRRGADNIHIIRKLKAAAYGAI